MMYVINENVAAGTTQKAPVEVLLTAAPGVIHQVEIVFPDGCNNHVYCAIYRFEHQIFPSNGSEFFIGNDETIRFRDFYELTVNPSVIKILFWAPDTTFDHKITVRLGILDRKFIEIVPKWIETLEKMSEVFTIPAVVEVGG